MFKIIGKIDGMMQEITYEFKEGKGTISGDEAIMFLLQWELDSKTIVGPVGQYMEADINNPLSVLFAIRKCLDSIEHAEGEIPEAESIPEDSIC